MSSEKTLAIVIRLVEFSESSYIATLFTEDFGKITGLAKGARRRKSAFESALDLLAISRVVFIRKTSDAMDLLTEAKLERAFRSASRDLARLYAGFYVAELLNSLTDERDPHRDLFRIASQTLLSLDCPKGSGPFLGQSSDDGQVANDVLRFELATLRILGHLPSLEECVGCGKTIEAKGRIAFGQRFGGVFCQRCKVGKRGIVSLGSDTISAMRTAADYQNPNLKELQENRKTWGELRGVVNNYICHLLGRRPRLHDFLFPKHAAAKFG